MSKCPRPERCQRQKGNIAPLNEIKRFIIECLLKLEVNEDKASIFADSLIAADYRGIYSHGLNRLENYLKDIREKICDANADPEITMEYASTAAVFGKNGLGAIVGIFCMDLAMKKAAETGIGLVVANGSNHFGINMFYTEYATEKGFIGLAFSNTSPVMVPTGAKNVCLGTNPLSLAAPGESNDQLVIDMATTAVALGKIEIYRQNNEPIPLWWALDEDGQQTTDPEVAMKNRKLMPLGGEMNYKGTALALLVECFSGLLADSSYGHNVRMWGQQTTAPANLGHGFIAIDPKKFPSGFQHRLSDLLNHIRNMEQADPEVPILVPGDIERAEKNKIDQQGGIIYKAKQLDILERLSSEFNIKPIQFI
ncbi:(2R)-3-sulfolactate dehydrogenase (NADP(+))-like [Diorhabda carinulata]|uniref:(2R)-3-sulfolactate dehydrogenase (NADP(+))-like n=1 Tax=Diorhabda carinulata TaxID=1163345 RepID=UPI0025A2B4A7|nr:(2R)-3-sulfolactate dehydrogenase (NADP(+))-like [Diorhabda carinulata]